MLIPALSVGALQAALISFFLIKRNARRPSDVPLIIFLVVVALQLVFKVASKSWMWHNMKLFYIMSYHLPLAVGPLLFLFVRLRQRKVRFTFVEVLHFFPLLLGISHCLVVDFFGYPLLRSPYNEMLSWPTIRILSIVTYTFLCFKEVRLMENERARRSYERFVAWIMSAEIIIVITIALMFSYSRHFPDVRLLFIVLTILVYWLSYQLMTASPVFVAITPVQKYTHSGLRPKKVDLIAQKIRKVMEENKLFLDPAASVESVATKLGISKHHVSQAVNNHFNKTFVDLLNEYRLDEACKMLVDPRHTDSKIIVIALGAGFNSSSSFNKIFKRRFGITPTEYRAQKLP